jgi:hypothetical protein
MFAQGGLTACKPPDALRLHVDLIVLICLFGLLMQPALMCGTSQCCAYFCGMPMWRVLLCSIARNVYAGRLTACEFPCAVRLHVDLIVPLICLFGLLMRPAVMCGTSQCCAAFCGMLTWHVLMCNITQ